jgi:hypothetical protein
MQPLRSEAGRVCRELCSWILLVNKSFYQIAMKTSLSLLGRYLLLTVPLLFSAGSAMAQGLGAEISYEKVPGGPFTYRVTLRSYVICSSYTPPSIKYIDVVPYVSNPSWPCPEFFFTIPLDTVMEVTDVCPGTVTTCDSAGAVLHGVKAYVYQGIVNLKQGCPYAASTFSGWRLASNQWRHQPYPINLWSLSQPDRIWVGASILVDSALVNSSATLNPNPIFYACVNDTIIYNQQTSDPDGDSLIYTLEAAQAGDFGGPETYAAGYSAQQPFGTSSSLPASMDPATGQLQFKADSLGLYSVGFKVEEFRTINGTAVKVGSQTREIIVRIANCTSTCPYFSNLISTGSGTQVNSNASVLANPGANVQLTIPAHCTNPNLDLTMTSNCANEIPGSTFTVTGSGTSVTGQFSWNPTTADVRTAPYYFTYYVKDNACPVPNQRYGAMRVLVTNSILGTPEVMISEAVIPNVLAAGQAWLLPSDMQGAQVTLFDAIGKQVYQSGSYANRFTAEGLSTGVYLYHIMPKGTHFPISGQLSLQ